MPDVTERAFPLNITCAVFQYIQGQRRHRPHAGKLIQLLTDPCIGPLVW